MFKLTLAAALTSAALAAQFPAQAAEPVIGLITKTETNPFFVKMKEGAAAGGQGQGRQAADRRRQGRRRQRRPGHRDREHDRRRRQGHPDHAERLQGHRARDQEGARAKGVMVIALDSPTDPQERHRRAVRHRQLQGRRADRPVRQGRDGAASRRRSPRSTCSPATRSARSATTASCKGFGLQRTDAKSNELGQLGRGGVHGRQLRRPGQGPDRDGELPAEEPRHQPRLHHQRAGRRRRLHTRCKAAGKEKDVMIVSVDGGCAGVQGRRGRQDRRHLAAVPAEDGRRWASRPASTTPRPARRSSGYTDTGVTLIADKPVAGVDEQGHRRSAPELCWGKK